MCDKEENICTSAGEGISKIWENRSLFQACNGEAFDRHFFGLKVIAVESGIDLPEFFMDKTFSHALHFNMSTSQVC